MVHTEFAFIDDYNEFDIFPMQGVEGVLRAAPHLMSIHEPLWGR